MGLIKSDNVPVTASTFSVTDIEKQAVALLLRARQQSDQILAAARERAKLITQDAFSKGSDEGKRAGLEKGLAEGRTQGLKQGTEQALAEHRAKLDELAATLQQVITEFETQRCAMEEKAPSEVIELSCAIAQRVTKRLSEIDPMVLEANVREALKLVVRNGDITVAVHPTQQELLQELLPELSAIFPVAQHARLVPDDKVAPGGCIVLTGEGEVDTSIDTQLERLVNEVLPRREA